MALALYCCINASLRPGKAEVWKLPTLADGRSQHPFPSPPASAGEQRHPLQFRGAATGGRCALTVTPGRPGPKRRERAARSRAIPNHSRLGAVSSVCLTHGEIDWIRIGERVKKPIHRAIRKIYLATTDINKIKNY